MFVNQLIWFNAWSKGHVAFLCPLSLSLLARQSHRQYSQTHLTLKKGGLVSGRLFSPSCAAASDDNVSSVSFLLAESPFLKNLLY